MSLYEAFMDELAGTVKIIKEVVDNKDLFEKFDQTDLKAVLTLAKKKIEAALLILERLP